MLLQKVKKQGCSESKRHIERKEKETEAMRENKDIETICTILMCTHAQQQTADKSPSQTVK